MPISVNPTVPVITAQGVASGLVLQPGTVINAQVLKILADNLVQIAIANLSIDVLSEVPLQAGQNIAACGVADARRHPARGGRAGRRCGDRRRARGHRHPGAGCDACSATLAPAGNAVAVANPPVNAVPSVNALTPLERSAVSAAVQTAVTQQGSLAPLFANLGVVASSGGLPPALQQAVAQVLAQRSSLDQNLTGSDVKNAFESSGLFLEASLASGSVSTASGLPDLKAALIVLRQTLLSSLGTADSPAATATAQPQSAVPQRQPFQRQPIPPPRMRPPCRMPRLCQQHLRRRCLPKSMRRKFFCRRSCHRPHCSDTGAHATTAGAALNLLQEVLQKAQETARKLARKSASKPAGNRQSVAGIGDAE